MSTAELTRTSNGHKTEALSDQVVLSGAGLLSQGIDASRVNMTHLISLVDDAVLASLDLMDEWNTMTSKFAKQFTQQATEFAQQASKQATELSNQANEFALQAIAKPIAAARAGYTKGTATVRELIGSV